MMRRTQNKIILIMSFLAMGLMAGLYLLKKFDHDKIVLLLADQRAEKSALIDEILELKSKGAANFAEAYATWDEMVRFVKSGDKTWAKQNIEVSMPTFRIDLVWIYRADFTLVYKADRLGPKRADPLTLTAGITRKIASEKPVCHFFIQADAGLIEIYGASIHPTLDQKRETPPRGYLFAGCLWSENYLKEISALTEADIRLAPPGEKGPDAEKEKSGVLVLVNRKSLRGWNGGRLTDAVFSSKASIAMKLIKQSNVQFSIVVAYLIVLLSLLSLILFRFINRPLNLLAKSLKNGDADPIRELTAQKNEFGRLAALAAEFFSQKNRLVSEIAEHKRSEEALKENEKRMSDILFSMADWVWEVDQNGVYTYSSERSRDLFGLSRGDIIGKTPFDFMPDEEAEKIAPIFTEIAANKRNIKDLENWNIGKNGQRICLLTNGVPLLDENGNLKGYRGVDKDITDRKRSEEALRRSETKFRTLYESTSDAVMLLDRKGFFDCNQATLAIFGCATREEFCSKHPSDVSPPRQPGGEDSVAFSDEKIKTALEKGSNRFEWMHSRIDTGKTFPAEVLLNAMELDGRQVVQAVVRDITERKRTEEKVNLLLKEKEALVKEVYHRVKNNFTVVSSLLGLQSQQVEDEKVQAMFMESRDRIRSMSLIHERLYLSDDLSHIDFTEYIRTLAADLHRTYEAEGSRAVLTVEADEVTLGVDQAIPCGLILNELISNALKYGIPAGGKAGGRIDVTLRKTGGREIELAVKDNGAGLPADFNIGETRSLGLKIIKLLVEDQLGGDLRIVGNGGTGFFVKFGIAG